MGTPVAVTSPSGSALALRAVAVAVVIASIVVLTPNSDAQKTHPWFPPQDPWAIPLLGEDPRWPAVRGVGVCLTDYGWCPLAYPEQVPPGAPCYCLTEAFQEIMGVTAARTYYGNVSPYFNPWR